MLLGIIVRVKTKKDFVDSSPEMVIPKKKKKKKEKKKVRLHTFTAMAVLSHVGLTRS